jgi:glycosyltransferase involved in cell wall biosynthesis
MSQRKVVFVNRFFYPDHSATSQILTDLAFDLAREGLDVSVITSRLRYDDSAAKLPRLERVEGVTVQRIWTSSLGRANLTARALDYFTFYISVMWNLWRTADRDTVVIAKTDPPLLSLVVAPIAALRGARLVNWLQDLFPEVAGTLGMRLVRGPTLALLRFARNATLRSAHTNVVLGERMEELLRQQGISSNQIRIIPNWADGEHIRPLARDANLLRREWGLENKFVVAYSGNLGRAHEFETILDAADALAHRPEIAFLFIGGGAQRETVEREVVRRGLPNVMFKPYQPRERLSQSLGVADVHLVSLNPALEGLIVPSKFYGVAAAGRLTIFIGDPDGEIARILNATASGFTVPSGDAPRLAQLIVELAGDPAQCESMGARARSTFDERFDRKRGVLAWKNVLAGGADR